MLVQACDVFPQLWHDAVGNGSASCNGGGLNGSAKGGVREVDFSVAAYSEYR